MPTEIASWPSWFYRTPGGRNLDAEPERRIGEENGPGRSEDCFREVPREPAGSRPHRAVLVKCSLASSGAFGDPGDGCPSTLPTTQHDGVAHGVLLPVWGT